MKPAILIVGFAVAGVFGALAGTLFRSERVEVASAPTDTARIDSRLQSVEAELARLRDGQTALMRTARESVDAPVAAAAPAAAAAESVPVPVEEGALKDAVREVVEEQAREAREQRAEREATMAAERESRMLERMQESLQLTPYQQDQMKDILGRRRAAMLALRDKIRSSDGPPSDEVRQEFQKTREQFDAELAQVLSPAQYETFKASDGAGGPGGGGGRGRGGR